MKVRIEATFTERAAKRLPLSLGKVIDKYSSDEATAILRSCSWSPAIFKGKEAEEILTFFKFACTTEFWKCIQTLRPGTQKQSVLSLIKNSDGDDPPDIEVLIPSAKPIGIEITDYSPVAAIVAKIGRRATTSIQIPGASDAKNFHQAEAFVRSRSWTQPFRTDFTAEQKTMVNYLSQQLRDKDVPGNEILLFSKAFSEGWPETHWAKTAKDLVKPKHIRLMVIQGPRNASVI